MGQKRRPLFKRTKARNIRLTKDDIALINYVGKHRFRRTSDILRHLSHRSAKHLRQRLRLLYDHGYLDLPKAQLNDHTTTGKPEKIYALGNNGAALIAERSGVEPVKSNWSDKNRTVKRAHIQHTLRIGDIEDAFARTSSHDPTIKVLSADDILAMAPETTARDPKPWLWQTHVRQANGYLLLAKAIPDAVLGLDLTTERKRYFYWLEADRGTMPVLRTKQATSSVARKFEAYLAGYHAGLHTTRYGIKNIRFLIITTSQKRIDTMVATLSKMANQKDCSMFLFADWHQVNQADHALQITWRNGNNAPVSLLSIPPTPKGENNGRHSN
jgi:hypothetical protein